MKKENVKPRLTAEQPARRAPLTRPNPKARSTGGALPALLKRLADWNQSWSASKETMPRYRHD
jgi:hypothetical protein